MKKKELYDVCHSISKIFQRTNSTSFWFPPIPNPQWSAYHMNDNEQQQISFGECWNWNDFKYWPFFDWMYIIFDYLIYEKIHWIDLNSLISWTELFRSSLSLFKWHLFALLFHLVFWILVLLMSKVEFPPRIIIFP